MSQIQTLLNRKQTAEVLGIKPQTLSVWSSSKRYDLPFIKVGSRALYSPADIDAFIARRRVGGAA